jgi:hypothetical protein
MRPPEIAVQDKDEKAGASERFTVSLPHRPVTIL